MRACWWLATACVYFAAQGVKPSNLAARSPMSALIPAEVAGNTIYQLTGEALAATALCLTDQSALVWLLSVTSTSECRPPQSAEMRM